MGMPLGEVYLLRKYKGDRLACAKAVLLGEEDSEWASSLLEVFWLQAAEAAMRLEHEGVIPCKEEKPSD